MITIDEIEGTGEEAVVTYCKTLSQNEKTQKPQLRYLVPYPRVKPGTSRMQLNSVATALT